MIELKILFQFFLKFLGVYLAEKKAAIERKEKFELDETQMLHLTCTTLQSMREKSAVERRMAEKAEEWVEKELKKPEGEN